MTRAVTHVGWAARIWARLCLYSGWRSTGFVCWDRMSLGWLGAHIPGYRWLCWPIVHNCIILMISPPHYTPPYSQDSPLSRTVVHLHLSSTAQVDKWYHEEHCNHHHPPLVLPQQGLLRHHHRLLLLLPYSRPSNIWVHILYRPLYHFQCKLLIYSVRAIIYLSDVFQLLDVHPIVGCKNIQ